MQIDKVGLAAAPRKEAAITVVSRTPFHTVVLLGQRGLLRDLLFHWLRDAPDLKVQQVSEPSSIDDPSPGLIITFADDDETADLHARVETLKTTFPRSAVAVVVPNEDRHVVDEAIAAGAEGIIPISIASRALMPALRILLAGERFVASTLATRVAPPALPVPTARAEGAKPGKASMLSARELQVVELLRKGMSNRAIADALAIQENTVKVHVRNLLRKLNVRSRFQVIVAQLPPTGD